MCVVNTSSFSLRYEAKLLPKFELTGSVLNSSPYYPSLHLHCDHEMPNFAVLERLLFCTTFKLLLCSFQPVLFFPFPPV